MAQSKPWYKSLTIVPSLVLALTSWAVSVGLITQAESDAGLTAMDSFVSTIEHVAAFLGVVGLRRAVSPIQGPGAAAKTVAAVALAGAFALSCVSYDAATVRSNVATYADASTLTVFECQAFSATSDALRDGPDRAYYIVGRAGEVRQMATTLSKQGQVCEEALERGNLTDEQLEAMSAAFSRTWKSAGEAIQ